MVIAASTALTACSNGTTASSGTDSSVSSKVETNADREKINIRFAQFGNSVDDATAMANDPIKQQIESDVNVTLEYDTGTDGFDDRMSTELSTGGAADLFPTWGETDKISKWASQGLIVNISEIVNADPERYPTLYKIINSEEYKGYNKLYTGDENSAYAIYGIASFAEPSFAGVPVYNQSILNQVNSGSTPKTVEEFLAYCKAAGSAGYSGWWPRNDKLTNWAEIDKTLAAPQGTTILAPSGDAWTGFVLSGTLGTDSETWSLATTSDASKAVVKQLAELYQNGGLDRNIGTKGDFDDAYADFGAGKIGAVNFGFGYPQQFTDFYNSCWAAANQNAQSSDLTVGYALTEDGNYGKTYTTGTWVNSHYFIPTSCKNPDRVLDLVEYLASSKGQDLLFNTVDGKYNTAQDTSYWTPIDTGYGTTDGRCKYVWFTYLFCGTEYRVDFTNNDWWKAVSNPQDFSENWATASDKALTQKAESVVSTYRSSVVTTLPSYYNYVTLPTDASDIRTKLADITNKYLSQMIGGQMDIDSSWSKYQDEYKAAGSEKLETMVNDAIKTARSLA